MKKEILTINSKCDGLPLSVAVTYPEGEAKDEIKGIVQFSHGMAEHKERYFGFMEFLAEHGYVSIINDHRGHGGSVKSQDDLGYFYDETATYIVEDTHQLTEYIKERFPGVPITLFGHSMGSIVVRQYLKKYDNEIDKLVACGAPGKNPAAAMAGMLIKLIQTFKGDKHRSKLMYNLSIGAYAKAVPNAKSPCDWLSYNEANVKEYLADPLCGFNFTLNGYKNLMGLLSGIFDENGWEMKNSELPIFFIAGAEDPVIEKEENWQASQDFLRAAGYNNVSGKLYKDMRHEILLETDCKQVYEDVLNFIES